MIPDYITREHVELAIQKININGIPKMRNARTWAVSYENKKYPVKLLISWGHESYNGQELDSHKFISTEARIYLHNLKFTIVKI
jgi:hypothetical protein